MFLIIKSVTDNIKNRVINIYTQCKTLSEHMFVICCESLKQK